MKVLAHDKQLDLWNQFILDGNQNALSQLYFNYYDLLFDYGQRHSSNKQLVEDTIQDVFINIIKFRKNIGVVKNLTGYLICTFRRELFLKIKRRKKTILTELIPEEYFDYFKNPEQDISEAENLEQLHSAVKLCVSKLSTNQREIIYLRFERDIPYDEIAGILNISVESCYKSTYRSIKAIRSEVEKMLENKVNILLWILFRPTHKAIKP